MSYPVAPKPQRSALFRVSRRALDPFCPKIRVAFVHVPKCGGTSVYEPVKHCYPLSYRYVQAYDTFTAAAVSSDPETDRLGCLHHVARLRRDLMSYHLARGEMCVIGHCPIAKNSLDAFPDVAFVTMLRDPVQRFKSHFRFSYRNGRYGEIAESIDDFLDSRRASFMGRLYSKYFSGFDIGAHDASAAETAAIANLRRFAVVGFLDRIASFEEGLSRSLGRKIAIPHRNKGPVVAAAAEIAFTPAQEARIAELCVSDIRVYETIRAETARG